jgi:chlorite dismutase
MGILRQFSILAMVLLLVGFSASFAIAAADREKLLGEPGVYGTFAAYSFDEEWAKVDQATRMPI